MFHYISGEIRLAEQEFFVLADAILAGIRSGARSFKVYDKDGNICHDSNHKDDDSYA